MEFTRIPGTDLQVSRIALGTWVMGGWLYDPRWAWHAAEELGAEASYPPQYRRCPPARWPQAFPPHQAVE